MLPRTDLFCLQPTLRGHGEEYQDEKDSSIVCPSGPVRRSLRW